MHAARNENQILSLVQLPSFEPIHTGRTLGRKTDRPRHPVREEDLEQLSRFQIPLMRIRNSLTEPLMTMPPMANGENTNGHVHPNGYVESNGELSNQWQRELESVVRTLVIVQEYSKAGVPERIDKKLMYMRLVAREIMRKMRASCQDRGCFDMTLLDIARQHPRGIVCEEIFRALQGSKQDPYTLAALREITTSRRRKHQIEEAICKLHRPDLVEKTKEVPGLFDYGYHMWEYDFELEK